MSIICRKCRTLNKDTARFCKKCGAELEPFASVRPAVKVCRNCGRTIGAMDSTCVYCGARTGYGGETGPLTGETTVPLQYQKEEELPEEYRPLSPWAYFGWTVLFTVVPLGWIGAIVLSFGGTKNINLRNFARSMFCFVAVMLVLILITAGAAGCTAGSMFY